MPIPAGVGFIDQMSFTFNDDFHRNRPLRQKVKECGGRADGITDRHVITESVAALLSDVFGLQVGAQRMSGLNFYKATWNLSYSAGMVSMGGKNNTILVQITGQGMAMARSGWQQRLAAWVALMNRFVITRLDLAYDDHEGALYNVDRAATDYDTGGYSMGGRPPSCEMKGNWRRIEGAGRSFYVGKRDNGKMLRVYEKGRQLGDQSSLWTRFEVEIRNNDRDIPFEILTESDSYFVGAYKCLERLLDASALVTL